MHIFFVAIQHVNLVLKGIFKLSLASYRGLLDILFWQEKFS